MNFQPVIDFDLVWTYAKNVFCLGPDSFHGPDHWRRVEANGLRMASWSGADPEVVRLFAILHDSHRENEGCDPEHGRRAAAYARRLRSVVFDLSAERFTLLEEAIALHADGKLSADPTIGTCWDSDRLDLPRVGIWPTADLLSTKAARRFLIEMETDRPSFMK